MMNDPDRFSPETVGRVVRWAILIFLGYIFIQHMWPYVPDIQPKPPAEQAKTPAAASPKEPEECAGTVFNNFSLFAAPLFPVSSPRVSIADIAVGTGAPLMCGQKATLRYTYAQRGGDIIFSNMDSGAETKDLLIGGREVVPGFERAMIGMKPGGERDMTIPPELGFGMVSKIESLRDHEQFKFGGITGFMTARAKLISVSPELPASPLKLRMIEQYLGDGRVFECGDDASITLSLWKLDGTRLFSNEGGAPLRFTLGQSQMPFGIEQAVLGMMPDGKRTVIIPPAYAKPLVDTGKALLKDVTLPEEILLATIQIVRPDATKPAETSASKPTEPKE